MMENKKQKSGTFFCNNFFIKNRRGVILMENLVFIILNLVFLSILILFIVIKMNDVAILEEKYSKEIALILDSAKPEMEIYLDMGDLFDMAKKENFAFNDIVKIDGNAVHVQSREKGGYDYSFFNNVRVSAYAEEVSDGKYENKYSGRYVFIVT